MAGLWLMKQVRHAAGATTNVYRPERTQLAGTLNLPGTRASIQLWDVDGVACVYNPHDRSVSVIAELEVQGFLMHDTPERFDLAEQFDRVLGPFTQRPGIKRVTLQERTLPTTIRAAREHYDTVRARPPARPGLPRRPQLRRGDGPVGAVRGRAPQLHHLHPGPGRPRRAAEVPRRREGRDPRPRRDRGREPGRRA